MLPLLHAVRLARQLLPGVGRRLHDGPADLDGVTKSLLGVDDTDCLAEEEKAAGWCQDLLYLLLELDFFLESINLSNKV